MKHLFWRLFVGTWRVAYPNGNISVIMSWSWAQDYSRRLGGEVLPDYEFEDGWTKECEYYIRRRGIL